MNRPHKIVEYDLDTVLSKENESSPTIMSETEIKPNLGMNRPHKTVEYDLDTVLSKENESSPAIMSETEIKPDHNVGNRNQT
jgi:hypothetical protein